MQELYRVRVGGAEPVRFVGVELGDLPRAQGVVAFAEDEPEPAGEDVEPLIAGVCDEQVEGGLTLARLEPRQGADRDAAVRGDRLQGESSIPTQRPQPWADVVEYRGAGGRCSPSAR
jgi:hypothetical protein